MNKAPRSEAQKAAALAWVRARSLGRGQKKAVAAPKPTFADVPASEAYATGLRQGERAARAYWAKGYRHTSIVDNSYYKGVIDGYDKTVTALLQGNDPTTDPTGLQAVGEGREEGK